METHAQRLAAYLQHARGDYTDEQVRELEMAAAAADRRLAGLGAEQRTSYQDLFDLLSTAIAEKFPMPTDDDGWSYWGYLVDFDEDAAVFSQKGIKYQVPYSIDGNTVTLGDRVPVREVTTYVPVEAKSAQAPAATESKLANFATPKRAFSSLVEQPPAHTGEFQIRMAAADDADGGMTARFTGYASVTGVPYEVRDWLGEYRERMNAGSFAKTLREQGNVPLLFNHDGVPLASTGSGTSTLAEDRTGLRNDADFDRRDGLTNSICVQLERGVLNKMSFTFRAIKETWNDSYDERGVNEAALYDTSIVTYPANPTTTAALQDEMRSALGREGRSLWVAEHDLSVRSALPVLIEKRELDADQDDLLERALRALVQADEVLSRRQGPHGRARTFHVASSILALRSGKVLSAANEQLLKTALDALSAADRQHQSLAESHSTASDAVSSVLGAAQGSGQSGDGTSTGTPPGSPINPQDGGGARSRALRLRREREAELRALRQR